MNGVTTADKIFLAIKLSGANPATSNNFDIPGLPTTGVIRKVELEYRGTLTSKLRWVAAISSTAPQNSTAIMEKMFQSGGVGGHDAAAFFDPRVIQGPPITMSVDTPRILYIALERGAHADTSLACTFTVHVDVATQPSATVDHLVL